MLIFSDLLPRPIARLWLWLRRALVVGSVLIVVGAAAVGTGRTVDSRIVRKQPVVQPVVQIEKSDATVELMHDVTDEQQISPNVMRPQTVTIEPGRRVVWMEVTAYCACKKCCGPNAIGLTASGRRVSYNSGKFVAADTSVLPFGTKLIIPGYDSQPVEVIDRGSAIKGNKLDVFFASHEEAMKWGRQMIAVTVVE